MNPRTMVFKYFKNIINNAGFNERMNTIQDMNQSFIPILKRQLKIKNKSKLFLKIGRPKAIIK